MSRQLTVSEEVDRMLLPELNYSVNACQNKMYSIHGLPSEVLLRFEYFLKIPIVHKYSCQRCFELFGHERGNLRIAAACKHAAPELSRPTCSFISNYASYRLHSPQPLVSARRYQEVSFSRMKPRCQCLLLPETRPFRRSEVPFQHFECTRCVGSCNERSSK